jgi:hypothetical protein
MFTRTAPDTPVLVQDRDEHLFRRKRTPASERIYRRTPRPESRAGLADREIDDFMTAPRPRPE